MRDIEVKKLTLGENGDQITIASGPVIFDDQGRVLLTRDKKDNFWKFPGGTLHTDESLVACALREAKEEADASIIILDRTPFILLVNKSNSDGSQHLILLWHWLAEVQNEQSVFISPEGIEVSWFSPEEITSLEVGPNIIPTLTHFKNLVA